MFKQRLQELGIMILFFGVVGGIGSGIYWLIASASDRTQEILQVVGVCLIMLMLVTVIGYKVWEFIKWIAIEPYKNYKTNKNK